MSIADELYRWRWWFSAALVVIFVVLLGPLDMGRPIGWVAVFLFAVLLWLPMMVRWLRTARETQKAFRDGLAGR